MSRIDQLRKNYQRLCGLPWDREARGVAAGLDRRLRQGRRAEAAAPDRPVRGGDPPSWTSLASRRPDRRLRRLALQPAIFGLRRELLRVARRCLRTAPLADVQAGRSLGGSIRSSTPPRHPKRRSSRSTASAPCSGSSGSPRCCPWSRPTSAGRLLVLLPRRVRAKQLPPARRSRRLELPRGPDHRAAKGDQR